PYVILTGLCFSRMFLYLGLQSYPALIPVLQKEWEMSNTAAGSIVSVYQVGFLISLAGLSALTDWVSTKKIYLSSAIVFAFASLMFAFFARSYPSAVLLRFLMGIAVGGTYAPALKLISETFSSTLRGRAMGFFIAAGSLGHAASLAVTGWIAATYDWQTAFIVTSSIPVLGALIPFAVLTGLEERTPQPQVKALKKELLANRPAMLMIGGYSAHTWELEAQRAWTPAFLLACVLAMGATKDAAVQFGATFSSAMYIMGVFSTTIAGYLSDRWGRTAVIIAMMSISISCSFSFGWLIGGPMLLVMAVGLLYGFSVIAESPVFSSALTEVVSPDYLGTAYGLRSLIGFGAGAISPTVFGLILDVTNAGQANAAGYISNWGWAFSMLGFVALIGPWTMFRLRALPESLKMAGGKR
ncbi:MAG: MFS transporter, partial [Proteobacteria bacterium]|nr:MFS transporter [Pseudomonadota bacterium]